MSDPVLTSSELADLRDATDSWLPDLCDIWTESGGVNDAYGGRTYDPEVVVQAGVPCSLESGVQHEQTRALVAILANVQSFTVTFPANTSVVLHDHLTITSRNNLHLRVAAVLAPESWEIERRVVATVFTGE